MTPSTILTFFLLVITTLADPLISRNTSILTEITTIKDQCNTLNSTISTFNLNSNVTRTALKLQSQSSTLLNDVNDATKVVQSTSPLNQDDSVKVAQAVLSLSNVVYTLLDRFVSKKPVFDKALFGVGSVSALVKIDLQNLKTATGKFGNATTAKLEGDIQKLAPLVTADIDFHFYQALQVYSS